MTDAPQSDLQLDVAAVPEPDPLAAPEGFVVEADDGTRIHFLDWGGPATGPPGPATRSTGARSTDSSSDGSSVGVLLIHGIAQTAWTWTPVARRLRQRVRVVAADLRGHGLSDSPTEGYEPEHLVADLMAVAEGSGLVAGSGGGIVIAGHGFGAIVGAWLAAALGSDVAGLVLVDGGWEDVAQTSELEPGEFLRGLDEPPEVLRSMAAYLADRRDFDPRTWDADQEQSARAMVVEAHSKRLTPSTRPHAVAASVEAMFGYDPAVVLPSVEAPIAALQAADDEVRTHGRALEATQRALAAAGRPPIRVARFPGAGHNLMRYRPREVTAAILGFALTLWA